MTALLGIIVLGVGLGASLFLPVPQTLRTNFDAGQSLYALGEYEGAIIEYSKVVKFNSRVVREDSILIDYGEELELPILSAAWYQLGNAYKRSGKHDNAVEAFHHVTEAKGVSEDFRSLVQYQLAETRFLQEKYEESSKEYKRYVELFPKSDQAGQAYFYSGWSQFNRTLYDDAIATLEGMLVAYPDNNYAPDAQFRIASSYFEKEDYTRSIDEAEAVLQKYPESPVIAQAVYLEANAHDKMGNVQEAIDAYREVRDLYDRMYELLRGSFREGKNVDFESYRQLFETSSLRVAEIYRQEGEFENAYKELIAAQETAEERFYKAKVQMRLGDNYLEWERYDDAWKTYNQVIELYSDTPYPPNAQYQKGEARYYAADYAEARTEYLKVAVVYPDSETSLRAQSLYSAGWSMEKMGSADDALSIYAQVVERFPRSQPAPLCLLRIGRIHTEQQQVDDAVAAYKAIGDNYGNSRHAADANYGLGILFKQQGQFQEAVASFSQVGREAREVYVHALIEAANIHISQGRAAAGKAVLQELLEGVTGDRTLEATAQYQMAQLDLNNKNYVDAITGYTKVIEDYAESGVASDSHYGRGLAYHHAGRFTSALKDYHWLLNSDLPVAMTLKIEFAMALSYSAQGKDEESLRLLNRVIEGDDETLARNARLQLVSMAEKKDPQDAIRIYEGMLSKLDTEEDKVRVLVRLASAYFRMEQFDRSIETSQQLIDLEVGVESISNALFLQGNSYFKSGKMDQAVGIYQAIIANYPQIGWAKNAQFQLGICYNKMSAGGNVQYLPLLSKAFETYYTTYPEDDKAVFAYYYDAWARYRLGNWRDASNTFRRLAKVHPRSKYAPEALFRSGEAVFNLAQGLGPSAKEAIFAEAMANYDEVIDRYPNSDHADDALYNRAWALIKLGREDEAIPVFEQIVAEHPDGRYGAKSQFTLGDYYYGQKDYLRATESYNIFLEQYPEERLAKENKKLRRKATVLLGHLSEIDAYAMYAVGEKLFDERDYLEAIKIFRDVQEKYPTSDQSVNAAVNIGAAFMAMEDYRKAAEEFQGVVEDYSGVSKFTPQVDFSNQQLKQLEEARLL